MMEYRSISTWGISTFSMPPEDEVLVDESVSKAMGILPEVQKVPLAAWCLIGDTSGVSCGRGLTNGAVADRDIKGFDFAVLRLAVVLLRDGTCHDSSASRLSLRLAALASAESALAETDNLRPSLPSKFHLPACFLGGGS